MTQELTPHFSRKVLLLSIIFLLANLGIYGLRQLAALPQTLSPITPKLVSATLKDIEVRLPYEDDYRKAGEGQEVYSGTLIKTSEKEFTELVVGQNVLRLDEQTEVRLISSNFAGAYAYLPETPRLVLELLSGSLWVSAFDPIEVRSARAASEFHHNVGIVTYSAPINRHMVFTGDSVLSLLSESGEKLTEFILPLGNQVTFVDAQITDTYSALKPSKLKKELKMTPISGEIMADDWVVRNVAQLDEGQEEFMQELITSDTAYAIRKNMQKLISYVTFAPEAKRSLAIRQAGTTLAYLLGAVHEDDDVARAKELLAELDAIVEGREGDPLLKQLVVETLFAIRSVEQGSPAYLVKENLMQKVAQKEGPYVYRIYLSDLRKALFEGDIRSSERIGESWLGVWTPGKLQGNEKEFDRQSQILNHTILSHIDSVPLSILDIFDETGVRKMAAADDQEEARFEVTSDRLQISASLVSSYRYALAKQYLKNSYLSLDIENLSPNLASTQIFLENGKLLAQRIEYADDVLHGAAQPIDETSFREYFQTIQRDEALSEDLRKFFELDQEEVIEEAIVEAPTASQVAGNFLDARINVNFADISLLPDSGFQYQIRNARLMDRGANNETLSFDAKYDFVSNSVFDVMVDDKSYQGAFTLPDIVIVLREGGDLESKIQAPKLEEGVELLITDQDKIAALEGQAVAQDVARQLAYNQLTAAGIVIPEVKFNIEILDPLNLNQFRITSALIPRNDGGDAIEVAFDYHSGTGLVSGIVSGEGVILFETAGVDQMADLVLERVLELEKELKVVGQFTAYARQNDLYIDPADINYNENGLLSLSNLEQLGLGLVVSALYDGDTRTFVSVSHPLLSSQDIEVKPYFEELAKAYVVDFMGENGFFLTTDQVVTSYPFNKVSITLMNVGDYQFSFDLDIENEKALKVIRAGDSDVTDELSFDELKALPAQIDGEQAPSQPEEGSGPSLPSNPQS